jgi:hypothetical protein
VKQEVLAHPRDHVPRGAHADPHRPRVEQPSDGICIGGICRRIWTQSFERRLPIHAQLFGLEGVGQKGRADADGADLP